LPDDRQMTAHWVFIITNLKCTQIKYNEWNSHKRGVVRSSSSSRAEVKAAANKRDKQKIHA